MLQIVKSKKNLRLCVGILFACLALFAGSRSIAAEEMSLPYTITFSQSGYADYLSDYNYEQTDSVRSQYWAVLPQVTFAEENALAQTINHELDSFANAIAGYRSLYKYAHEVKYSDEQWQALQIKGIDSGIWSGFYSHVLPTMGVTEKTMLSVCFDVHQYMGGAHEAGTLYPYSIDLSTGNAITILDLLSDAAMFRSMLESFLLDEYHKAPFPDAGLDEITQVIRSWPTERGYFTREGYVALFNHYELTGYGSGRPRYTLTYDKILPFLNEYGKSMLSFLTNNGPELGTRPYYGEVLAAMEEFGLSEQAVVYNQVIDFSVDSWRLHGVSANFEARDYLSQVVHNNEYTYEIRDYGVYLLGYHGADPHVVVPDKIHGLPVVSLGDAWSTWGGSFWPLQDGAYEDWFFGGEINACNYLLKSVILPHTLETIESGSFQHCWNLETLVIPPNVSRFEGAFVNCPKLILEIDERNPYYTAKEQVVYSKDGRRLVYYPPSSVALRYDIPEGVTKIESYAFAFSAGLLYQYHFDTQPFYFRNTGNLETVVFPSTLETIGKFAFQECYSLANVHLNEGLRIIGEEAFMGCKALQTISIPKTVKRIEVGAFLGSGLTNVLLQDGLLYIGHSAFDECPLMELNIPKSVESPSAVFFRYGEPTYEIPVKVWKGSYAHQQAVEQGLVFSLNDEPAPTGHKTEGVIGTIIITNNDSARVRKGNNADTAQIGLVNPGEAYHCVGIASNGWYEIVYPSGQAGFISNKLAQFKPDVYDSRTFSYPIGIVTITHPYSVKTHNGGSVNHSFMGSVDPGEVFPCVGIAQSGWYAILLPNGWIVYISDSLATLTLYAETQAEQASAGLNSRYEIFVESVSWEEAARRCKERSGHLAIILTQAQQQTIVRLIEAHEHQQTVLFGEQHTFYYWIGGQRHGSSDEYYWGSGDRVNDGYTNWLSGEPSFVDRNRGTVETCMIIFGKQTTRTEVSYLWNDENNHPPEVDKGLYAYICQY